MTFGRIARRSIYQISPVGLLFFSNFWKTWASDPALVTDVLAHPRMGLRPEDATHGPREWKRRTLEEGAPRTHVTWVVKRLTRTKARA